MDDPRILARRNVGLLVDAARKKKAAVTDFEYRQPILDRSPGLLRQFELDRPAVFLNDRCAVAQPAADAQIVDLQTDEVAPPQFAVDRQVEHCEVTPARVDLKPGSYVSDFLWLEWAFLTDQSSFIPGRSLMILLLDDGLGHGSNLLADHSLPSSPLSAGQKHNA